MSEQAGQVTLDEVWKLFKETDEKFKETDEKFKETDEKFKETDRYLRRLEGLFGIQWGKMMEALVAPNALDLFRARGIDVHYIFPRVKVQHKGDTREFDLILENDDEVVVVEVKSTLRVEDVIDFLDDLAHFFDYFPRYQGCHVYGAVAGLDIVEEADRYAYKRGLFVLAVSGEGLVSIRNDERFQPRDFGHPSTPP